MTRFLLKLYISGKTHGTEQAIESLREICQDTLHEEYQVEVIDVLEHPERADQARVLATPTVIRTLPLPVRRIIGDLSDTERVLVGLDLRALSPDAHPLVP